MDPTGKTFTAQPGSGVGTTLAGTIAVMSATMLNQGVYDLAEAALLLGRGPGQIARRAGPAGGHGGQGVFQSVVRLYLQRVQFNDAGQPSLWRPADRVELDPRIQAGAPCIEGTRVPTATIADLLQSEDAKDIALDFDFSVEDVFAAGENRGTRALRLGLSDCPRTPALGLGWSHAHLGAAVRILSCLAAWSIRSS